MCESYSLDEESLGLQLKVYFYATYSAGSVGESDSLVHENHGLQPNSHFNASYPAGSIKYE